MLHPRTRLVLAAAALGHAGVVRAQPETVLTGQLDLARLVDVASQRLGLPLEYNAAELRGSVTLRLEEPLSDRQLWELTNRVLASKGFATVRPRDGVVYSVVPLAQAASIARVEREALESAEFPPSFVAIVRAAEHRPVSEIVESLRPALSKNGAMAPLGSDGLFMISDLSSRVEEAIALLPLVDTPRPPPSIERIEALRRPASQLASAAAQVAAKAEAVAGRKVPGEIIASPDATSVLVIAPPEHVEYWRALVRDLDQREPVETITYTPPHATPSDVASLVEQLAAPITGEPDDRWRVVADDLTGALIVTGTASQHAAIASLLDRLSAAPASSRLSLRTFVVRNRPVNDVAGIIEGLAARSLDPDDPSLPGRPSPPDTDRSPRAPAQAEAQRVQITVDEGTSSLIVLAEPRVLDQIEALLARLDVRQPQVMLEVLLVSLSQSQTRDLGVELERLEVHGGTLFRLSSLFGLSTRAAGGDLSPGDGSGLTGVILDPGEFAVILRALETLNHGRSISMPRLLVANNEHATLDAVLQQPFASVNASDTVATTSYAGSLPAGTQISIQPQIAEGDHVLLDYSVSLSSFVGASSDPNLPPPRQENKLQSAASIPDGHTVVLGGIELTTEGDAVSQVPLLGNVPVVGELFKSRGRTASRQRFYVFIRANVMRSGSFADLKYASDRAADDAGVDDGWPKVEPRIIR